MIRIRFRTNLDGMYLGYCPEYLSCRPQLGDYIIAGYKNDVRYLKICMIVHIMLKNYTNGAMVPGLEIELNK